MAKELDKRLTHRIVCDGGQWAKGKTEADARAKFKEIHSSRKLKDAQVWAVTESTVITESGGFRYNAEGRCEPLLISKLAAGKVVRI